MTEETKGAPAQGFGAHHDAGSALPIRKVKRPRTLVQSRWSCFDMSLGCYPVMPPGRVGVLRTSGGWVNSHTLISQRVSEL